MNNNSNHNTVWILGLIVVLVLGVLIGTNMKKPARVASNTTDQQGAVIRGGNINVNTASNKYWAAGECSYYVNGVYVGTNNNAFNTELSYYVNGNGNSVYTVGSMNMSCKTSAQ